MIFDIAAQIAQIPASVPANIKQTIIDAIKRTDLREKPSSLGCIDRIRAAAMTDDEKVSIIDILHGLAHAHWQVASKGSFDWGRIRGTTILDDQGRETRITTNPPPATRKVTPHLRKKFEETKEGQRLLGEKLFVYDGTDSDGKCVYRAHYDTFIGTQRHIDILEQQQLVLDTRYAAQTSAQANIDGHIHSMPIGEVSDHEGEPVNT